MTDHNKLCEANSDNTVEQQPKTQFTPGPWRVGYSDGSGTGNDWRDEGISITANNRSVVMGGDSAGCPMGVVAPALHIDERYRDEKLANAHLIAAAPELFKALENLALQDAPEGGLCYCPEDWHQDGHASYCNDARLALAKAQGGSL